MGQGLTWTDAGEIADALAEAFPDIDPLSLTFTRLHQMVVALPNFADDPDAANEGRLEEIQMAWYDLVE